MQELRRQEKKFSGSNAGGLYRAVVVDVLEPSEQLDYGLVRTFERFSRIVSTTGSSSASIRSWPPVFLVNVLLSVEDLESRASIRRSVAKNLKRLRGKLYEGGEAWEIVVQCAIMLRVDLLRYATRELSFFDVETNCLLPEALVTAVESTDAHRRRDLHVTFNCFEGSNATDAVEERRSDKPPQYPAVTFVIPKHSKLTPYDMLLVYYHAAGVPPIVHGYQIKSGKELPPQKPLKRVNKSFVIRGGNVAKPGPSGSQAAGWTVLSDNQRDSFLGPTFAPLLEFESSLPASDS